MKSLWGEFYFYFHIFFIEFKNIRYIRTRVSRSWLSYIRSSLDKFSILQTHIYTSLNHNHNIFTPPINILRNIKLYVNQTKKKRQQIKIQITSNVELSISNFNFFSSILTPHKSLAIICQFYVILRYSSSTLVDYWKLKINK